MRMIISASLLSAALAVSQAAQAQSSDPASTPASPDSQSAESASGMQPADSQLPAGEKSMDPNKQMHGGTHGSTMGSTGGTQGDMGQQQAGTNTSECDIGFRSGQTSADTSSVQTCLSQVDKASVKYINVLGVASPVGSESLNMRLSQQRAASVAEQLKREFPNAQVSSMGIGEQPNMEPSAKVTLVSVAGAETAQAGADDAAAGAAGADVAAGDGTTALPGQETATDDLGRVSLGEGVETEGAVRMNTARIAARVAQDDFDPVDEVLPFYGLEIAYVGRMPGATGVRWEAGAVGGVLAEQGDEADGYEAHGLLGAGYAFNNFVVGARALGGAVWNDRPGTSREAQEDFGGEARIGFEKDRWSIFAGAGATQEQTARLGIDLGVLL